LNLTRFFRKDPAPAAPSTGELAHERERMVVEQIERRDIKDARVLAALRKVERHRFLSPHQQTSAYGDHPLPIGDEQTISQPYIVALMTEALRLEGGERVLEIGTGSGYQTAILAELAGEVFSIELVQRLSERAQSVLDELGYDNVHLRVGDGRLGWPEHAPYEAILVAAAPREVPEALLAQLKENGRLVIPVGVMSQELEMHTRREDGHDVKRLAAVRFVPLR
jgi:protein-L-isoaspartate(D-aspartate) O-methyltransferase